MEQHFYGSGNNNIIKTKFYDLLAKVRLKMKIIIIKIIFNNYKKFIIRMNFVRKNNNKQSLKNFQLFPKNKHYNLNIKEDNIKNYGVITSSLWNLDSLQDYVWSKDNNLLLVDGHGTDTLINWIRDLNEEILVSAFMDNNNPIEFLENKLRHSFIDTKQSGACVTAVKIRENKIDIYKIGDTSARIYVNKELILETDDHSAQNKQEFERKKNEGAKFEKIMALYNLPPSKDGKINVSQKEGYYIHHSPLDVCISSRTMGHADKGKTSSTGKFIEHKSIYFTKEDEVLMMVCSDGVWDLIYKEEDLSGYTDASSIVLEACRRWHSDMNFIHWKGHNCKRCKAKRANNDPNPVITKQQGMLPDDISSIVWYKN